ncbi:methyltransferase domain-containing protein [Dyella sp. ASV21]|uniref:methyltransferase domain-containing protein n=1 Tax=Dyella sp. ASV21 TaxID=2795114 RepID=UPI0018EA694F|nr:methyltransferase domain-containing protein [Dyella sp. ASV21]
MLDALPTLIRELEQDRSLEQPDRLRERVQALDRLDELLQAGTCATDGADWRQRGEAVWARLDRVQQRLGEAIRLAIKQGAGGHALRGWVAPGERGHPGDPQGYDHLDALVSDVLAFEEPGVPLHALDADMVFYQPTPARHVFELIERVRFTPDDVLVDLGSGMGHVPLLVSICTRAHSIGIEREPVYAEAARRQAQALQLDRVEFLTQDAREADISRGTVFYLYTPFSGGILREMLDKLAHQGRQRPIRLATLGPCTDAVANEPWLELVGPREAHRITLFRSRG